MDQTAKIRKSILSFLWDDFGLNEVSTADPQYATALAEHISEGLKPPKSENEEEARVEGGSK